MPRAVPPRSSRVDSGGTINGANRRGLIKEILTPRASRPAPLSAPGAAPPAPETKGGGGAGPRFVGAEPGRAPRSLCGRGEQRRARIGAHGLLCPRLHPALLGPRSHAGLRCTAPRAPAGGRGCVLLCGAAHGGSPKNGSGVGVRRGGTRLYWHLSPSQSSIPAQHPRGVPLCSSPFPAEGAALGLLPLLPMLSHSP